MSTYATNRFPGDGVTTSYNFNFVGGYLSRDHVRCYRVDDATGERTTVFITPGQWTGPFQIGGFTPTPVGQTLVLHRMTPPFPLVDYSAGTRLTDTALDLTHRQGLFLAAEAMDGGGGSGDAGDISILEARLSALETRTGNVDNTRDFDKPISNLTALALATKAPINHRHALSEIAGDAATTGQVPVWDGTAWVPQTPTSGGGVSSVAGKTGAVTLDKSDVGLNSVDNTSDAGKPVSTAQAAALAGKAPISHNHALTEIAGGAATSGQVPTWSGSQWVPQTPSAAPVTSVAGRTGAVTLTKADVGLSNVDNTTDAGKPISTATAIALGGKAPTAHTHALTDLTQSGAVLDQVPGWDGAKWAPKTLSFTESGYPRIRVAVVGDSMAAQQVLADSLCWPERWAQMMKACGVAVDVMNLAVSGHTFYRANTQAINAIGQTVRDRVVQWSPSLIIVALGANDAILNVDGRTLAQTQADANTFINTVKTSLPSATIVAAREIMHDSVNFTNPGTTLLNKGTFPGVFALKSTGILTGLYTTEVLEDDVGATQRTRYANWVSLMATVTGNANVSSSFDINAWKIMRLGGAGTDGTHMTAMGHALLAGYVLKAAQANATLQLLWPHISTATFTTWSDPDNLFADTFTASGSGWVTKSDTYPSDWVSKHPGVATLRPDTWWNRSGAVVRFNSLSYPYNAAEPTYWSVARARRNQACQVSVNGGAWVGAGGSGVTDENGEALFVTNMAVLSVGSYTMRYRIGDESFGPVTLTVTAGTASPLLRVAPATETWNAVSNAFDTVKYGNVLANEGGGSWSAATGLYTAPKAGVYVISHNLGTGGGGSGANILLAGITVNGVVQAEGEPAYDTSGSFGSSVSISIRLAAGNTVGFAAYVAYTNAGVPGRGWGPIGRGRSCTGSIAYVAP